MALEFLRLLSTVPDPRRAQGKKWQLGPVLLATILAVLSGACSYRKVHLYIEARLDALNEAFGFGWREAPAYSSIRTILQCLDAQDVEQVFRVHAAGLAESEPDAAADTSSHEAEGTDALPVIAIDGKTLRHSFDGFNDRKAAHMLSAFAAGDALILGHLEVGEKTNEIPAAQEMIKALALEGRLFTLDAMHCQKNFRGSSACIKPSAGSGERQSAGLTPQVQETR